MVSQPSGNPVRTAPDTVVPDDRELNLIIRGLPEEENKNISMLVQELFKTMNLPFHLSETMGVEHLGKPTLVSLITILTHPTITKILQQLQIGFLHRWVTI